MSNFKFTEEAKDDLRTDLHTWDKQGLGFDWLVKAIEDNINSRIEQIVNERDGWIRVEDVNEEGYYYCLFDAVTGDQMQCVVRLQYVSRHNFDNPPMEKRLYVYPSFGHEIKTARYLRPLIPSPPKTESKCIMM